MAIVLEDRFSEGHLPGRGGWLDQDFYYILLIDLASNSKRIREKIESEKRARQARRRR